MKKLFAIAIVTLALGCGGKAKNDGLMENKGGEMSAQDAAPANPCAGNPCNPNPCNPCNPTPK